MIIASTCALDTESGAFVAGISESWESLLVEWLREPSNTASHYAVIITTSGTTFNITALMRYTGGELNAEGLVGEDEIEPNVTETHCLNSYFAITACSHVSYACPNCSHLLLYRSPNLFHQVTKSGHPSLTIMYSYITPDCL